MAYSDPIWATDESLKEAPGGVFMSEFDFSIEKSFPVFGFSKLKDLWKFEKRCCESQFIEDIYKSITKKKEELLSIWEDRKDCVSKKSKFKTKKEVHNG